MAKKRVFIAYAKGDATPVAQSLYHKLTTAGCNAFLDTEALERGEGYDFVIRDEIGKADLFVFILTPKSVEPGAYTLTELKLAKQRWKDPSGRVLVVPALPVDKNAIPKYLNAITPLWAEGDKATEALFDLDRMAARLAESPPPRVPPRTTPGRRRPPPPTDPDEDSRWLRGAKTALSDGLGIYLFCMLLLGIVATLLHQAMRPDRDEREALRDLVETEQEPYRPETLPTLVASLVTNTWKACDDREAISIISECHQLFQSLYRRETVNKASLPELSKLLSPAAFASRPSHPVVPCTPELAGCPAEQPSGSKGASTEKDSHSLLRVPSGVVEAFAASKSADAGNGSAGGAPRPDPLQDIADRSREIEALEPVIGRQVGDGARIVQMYFVSVEGVLRMLPKKGPKWPHYRVFNGASYVYAALGSDKSMKCQQSTLSITKPYLDLAGNGVVTTLCGPISQSADRIAGVFCVDVAHGRDAILHELETRASLFPLTLVRIGATSGNADKATVCGSEDFPAPAKCPSQLAARSAHDEDIAVEAARSWRKKLDVDPGGGARIYKYNDHRYVAGILESGDVYEVVVIDTTPGGARSIWWMVGAIGLLVVAGGLVIIGRLTRDRRREATLVRGMQVGVIRTNEHDEVVGVNDRIAEIFKRDDLPRLGLYSVRRARGKRVRFEDLLPEGRSILMINEHSGALERKDYRRLDAMRLAGIASRYWFKSGDRWVRVYGSPIAMPGGATHTFGLLEWETNESLLAQLEAKIS